MAEEKDLNADLEDDEFTDAEELEKLLEGDLDDIEEDVEETKGVKGFVSGLSLKAKALVVTGVLFVLLAAGGGAYYFLIIKGGQTSPEIDELVEEAPEDSEIKDEKSGDELKEHTFKLKPFLLPVRNEGEETGRFVSIAPNLQLSNKKLSGEIAKNLHFIRKNIYTLLLRKTPDFYENDRFRMEERLKREIIASTNALLFSGTGTITDVYFTEFVVK